MSTKQPNIPDKCCLTCHFLVEWDSQYGGRTSASPLARDKRDYFAEDAGVDEAIGHTTGLRCFADFWDAPPSGTNLCPDISKTLRQRRGVSCRFYPHKPGLLLPTARRLADQDHEQRKDRRDFWMTVTIIAITTVGVVVGIISVLIELE